MDVAQALVNLSRNPKVTGEINLPGPSTFTYEYLLELVESVTLRPPSKAPGLPKAIAQQIAKLGNAVWWPTIMMRDDGVGCPCLENPYYSDNEIRSLV